MLSPPASQCGAVNLISGVGMYALTWGGSLPVTKFLTDNHALVVANGLIDRVCPMAELPSGIEAPTLIEWEGPFSPVLLMCS